MQELSLAKLHKLSHVDIDIKRLHEVPTERLRRLIKREFWDNLTRVLDSKLIDVAGRDPKDWTDDPRPRIYIPRGAPEQHAYYTKVAVDRPEIRLDVCWLPEQITTDAVFALNSKPGLLAIAMEEVVDPATGNVDLKGLPFVVPGGRFNELYGWDSYMEALGLIECKKVNLAKAMVQHFIFSIKHYGKILNANRSYYLTRSQPPFLTDMAIRVFREIKSEPSALPFLRHAILAAIKEYHSVWMAAPRLDPVTGLSRYRPEGRGVPPETEATHFDELLRPYAEKHGITFKEFVEGYNNGTIQEPALDEYFLHDRAVRESGHDTSYRLEGCCANLATVDLNSLLYKYETDIAECIRSYFKDALVIPAEFCVGSMKPNQKESSAQWDRRAKLRKARIDKYLWNEKRGMYFDYDTVKKEQCTYESATTFWPLWANVAEAEQATRLVATAVPLFEVEGGLVSGTLKSRGEITLARPNRQWDFPFGWAPQQILAWEGLQNYGHKKISQRLAYRWMRMIIGAFVDYHGVVVEKYDVTAKIAPHKVEAEYGNQGADFKGVAREGYVYFWLNELNYSLTFLVASVGLIQAISSDISVWIFR